MSSASSLTLNDYLGCFFTALERDLLGHVYGKGQVEAIARENSWYKGLKSTGQFLNAVISFKLALAETNKGQNKEDVTRAILKTCQEEADKGTLPDYVAELKELLNLAMESKDQAEATTCQGTESLEQEGSGTLATTENGGKEEQPVSVPGLSQKTTGFRSTLSRWQSTVQKTFSTESAAGPHNQQTTSGSSDKPRAQY
jgi:hypothetical protein